MPFYSRKTSNWRIAAMKENGGHEGKSIKWCLGKGNFLKVCSILYLEISWLLTMTGRYKQTVPKERAFPGSLINLLTIVWLSNGPKVSRIAVYEALEKLRSVLVKGSCRINYSSKMHNSLAVWGSQKSERGLYIEKCMETTSNGIQQDKKTPKS